MQATKCLYPGLAVVAVFTVSVKAAEVDVLSWSHQTAVRIGNGNIADGTSTVTNPLQDTYFASLGNSMASSTINASWDAAGFFDFYLTGEYVDQGSSDGWSLSSGSVHFIPTVDSIITIDAEFNYALGSGDRESELRVNVGGGPAPPSSLFSQAWHAIPIGGGSPNGTFTIHASVPMLAGEFYAFGYGLALYSYGGSPTNLSHADGHLRLTIVPVPEPASALLLTFAGVVVFRRHRLSA